MSIDAWGLDVHRFLTRRAIDGLPAELRPFFLPHRDFIGEHSTDPDLWRVMGLRGELGDEDPNHFLDIDGLDEAAPFKGVPREWNAYLARYGAERAHRMGRLPWRTEEVFKMLVARFQETGRGTSPYAASNVRYLVAILAHYVEDAHVPFHAVLNYDGQLTGQRGIHARFENEVVLRNLSSLKLAPVKVHPIASIREFVFDTLVDSQSHVAAVLEADRSAVQGRDLYDDAYFARLFKQARPVLEKRLGEAASGVASAVVAAWVQAGKPKLPLDTVRPPARIRR
jgi:hypothetical protein